VLVLSTGADAVVVGAVDGLSPSPIFVTRTAATLNIGCFETGSHTVIVSSFDAPCDVSQR
jgi:hypothetical protein